MPSEGPFLDLEMMGEVEWNGASCGRRPWWEGRVWAEIMSDQSHIQWNVPEQKTRGEQNCKTRCV